MNDKYINYDQEELDRINDQAYAEQDYLYMQVENLERQIAEGITPVQVTTNLINKIKADAIREAADIDWVLVMNEPAILRSDLLELAHTYDNKIGN